MRIVPPSATLLWITPDAELVIERAGRVCYKSEDRITPGSAAKFIKMLIERGHDSVLEHAATSFLLVCDRGVTHELVRHRIASFSQESTRYCNYAAGKFGGEITVIQPPDLINGDYRLWAQACQDAERHYQALIVNGASPQIARSVLPTCLKAEIVITANLREWRHILRLRTSPAAHPQMRGIMMDVARILREQCPNVFRDLVIGEKVEP